jgi:two-component system sensor histidine kinase KdpD
VTGARFWFTLPVDTPPAVPAPPDDDIDDDIDAPGASFPSEPLPDHD